jgi:hypothetical protein
MLPSQCNSLFRRLRELFLHFSGFLGHTRTMSEGRGSASLDSVKIGQHGANLRFLLRRCRLLI